MPLSPISFFMDGPCNDQGYLNTRDHPRGIGHKQFVEDLWVRFRHLADRHFREDARNHFLQRFWEMYLAVTLLEHGFDLKRYGDEGPEFYTDIGKKRVWFEAIAPGPGVGVDQVPQLIFEEAEATNVPTEKILLRFTNSLDEKSRKYAAALAKGIVSEEDCYVLAINSRGIRYAPYGNSLPYFIQAFLPIGPLTIGIDTKTRKAIDSFYQYRPTILKFNGSTVSTRPFLDIENSFCSAVLHSGVDCANHPSQFGGDFQVLHNPNAKHPLNAAVIQWCEQFTFGDGMLNRKMPT